MASKQLVNNLSKVGRCAESLVRPLVAVRYSSSKAQRCDIEKVTHTGQVSRGALCRISCDRMRLRKHCFHSTNSLVL